jgi:hypothetical protein
MSDKLLVLLAADAAAARVSAGSLHEVASSPALRLAASEAYGYSCAAAASEAAARTAAVLTEVFLRSDQRVGEPLKLLDRPESGE